MKKATPSDSSALSKSPVTRRHFMAAAATASLFQVVPSRVLGLGGQTPPSEKLNIAGIGVGSMGGSNLERCVSENIVALCDVDHDYAAETFAAYPNATVYTDYREMFDQQKDIDAVVIATPDHTHAVITLAAMQLGKHVFLQKPLTRTVMESKKLLEAARYYGVQTQMGNQGHSSDHIRLMKEWLDDGAIGHVREVHAWTDRPVGGSPWSTYLIQGRPTETPAVPSTLDWDLWLGPAPYRPYHPDYHPMTWRSWYDFGTGSLGDMGCHILDPAFWTLDLGHPETVEATSTHWEEGVSSETFPRASIVRYHFPARGEKPPVDLTWYDGRLMPPVPDEWEPGRKFNDSGALLIGDQGGLVHGSHGAGGLRIFPETKMRAYDRPPPSIPRVEGGFGGHERDWIRACKDGVPASSSFEYGARLTEIVLLGVLALRLPNQKLHWDASTYSFKNNPEANALLDPPYRKGWTL